MRFGDRKKIVVPALLLILLAAMPLSRLTAQNTWYDQGKAATDNNRKVEFFTRALEEERKDSWVYYFRAWAYYNLGRYEKALRDFKSGETAEGNLDASFLYSGMAWCYYRLEQYDQAVKVADKAITARDNNSEAWNAKGWILIMQDKPADAVKAFSKFITLKPDQYLGYSNRSYAYAVP